MLIRAGVSQEEVRNIKGLAFTCWLFKKHLMHFWSVAFYHSREPFNMRVSPLIYQEEIVFLQHVSVHLDCVI